MVAREVSNLKVPVQIWIDAPILGINIMSEFDFIVLPPTPEDELRVEKKRTQSAIRFASMDLRNLEAKLSNFCDADAEYFELRMLSPKFGTDEYNELHRVTLKRRDLFTALSEFNATLTEKYKARLAEMD